MSGPASDLSDLALAERTAAVLAVPRASVVSGRESFVLHAPLELLARMVLLPRVDPSARALARQRIALLADAYEASGPPVDPARPADFASSAAAAAVLAGAIDAEDLDTVDQAATWLAGRVGIQDLVALLTPLALDRLSAAGHANIYLGLLARPSTPPLGATLLRPLARALADGADRRITIPPIDDDTNSEGGSTALVSVVAGAPRLGPATTPGIAPMVLRAQDGEAFAALLDSEGRFAAPPVAPVALLHVAARAMLQGDPAQAPYGWTHCLTLAQAPLLLARAGAAPAGPATWVAAAYVAAHWSAHGEGAVDLDRPVTPRPDITATSLATAAAVAHDAHIVKYTLACLDAADADPSQRDLYFAAADHLHQWWAQRGDPSDPLGHTAPT